MTSITSHETNRTNSENQECRLHSLSFCSLCHYDGTYSLDIENPAHQEIISKFLAKSRKKNNREFIYERANERRNNRRRFIQRIRERPRQESVAAEEVVVLSSDDDSDLISPTPSLLNATQKQITPEPAKVSTVSTKYNHAVGGNISNTSPKKMLTRTHLGITMPAGVPGTMTASVNYAASIGDSGVTCVSSGADRGKLGVPVVLNSLSAAADGSSSTSKSYQRPSVLTKTTTQPHSLAETTAPCTTDVNNFSLPGARTTNYSVKWLSIPNSSVTSSAPSGTNSINSSHQHQPALTDGAHVSDAHHSSVVSLSRLGKSSSAILNESINTSLTRINDTPQLKTVRSSKPGIHPSIKASLLRAPPVIGNPSNQHTSRSTANARPSTLSGSTMEGQISIPEKMRIPPPTCYHNSGRLAPANLCAEKCLEAGRCCIIRCSSKGCSTYIPSTTTDDSCRQKQSLVTFSAAPHNSQPWQQKTTSPRQISLDKCLKFQTQSNISRPSPRRDSISSLLLRTANAQPRAPYRFIMNNSPFSSQINSTLRSLRNRSLASQSSIKEKDHSRGQQPIPIETQVNNNAEPENTLCSGTNQDRNSTQRGDSQSPDEVVESYLTRMLHSSNAPNRNVMVPSGTRLQRSILSSIGAGPSQSATDKMVDSRAVVQMNATPSRQLMLNQRNDALHLFNGCKSVIENAAQNKPTSQSSGKHKLEAEEPSMKRLRNSPSQPSKSTVVDASSRINLSEGILTKSDELNTNLFESVSSADATPIGRQFLDMTTSIEPTLEDTRNSQMSTSDLSGHRVSECQSIASVNSSFSESNQDSNSQLEQPLPPFESINGKFKSGIKEYWNKSTPPPADEDQSLNDDPNLCVQEIRDWLLKDTSKTVPPALLSTTEDGSESSDLICQAPSDYTHIDEVQNCDMLYIKCDGKGFIVDASVMEQASPYFKQCTSKHTVDGVEYRMVHATGVNYWTMQEILKFVCHHSYNHNIMKSSHAKRSLDTLGIQYQRSQSYIYPV